MSVEEKNDDAEAQLFQNAMPEIFRLQHSKEIHNTIRVGFRVLGFLGFCWALESAAVGMAGKFTEVQVD